MFEQKLHEHMSARGFVNLEQLAEVLEGVAKPKRAPVLGEPELQAMARREFAASPWDFRRSGATLPLTEAKIDKLSRYYFGLN